MLVPRTSQMISSPPKKEPRLRRKTGCWWCWCWPNAAILSAGRLAPPPPPRSGDGCKISSRCYLVCLVHHAQNTPHAWWSAGTWSSTRALFTPRVLPWEWYQELRGRRTTTVQQLTKESTPTACSGRDDDPPPPRRRRWSHRYFNALGI